MESTPPEEVVFTGWPCIESTPPEEVILTGWPWMELGTSEPIRDDPALER